MKCDLAGAFLRPYSNPHWLHDSSLETSFCIVITGLIKKVIWTLHLGETLIFPISLQKCRKALVATVFLTFIKNHNTCIKTEGGFSYSTYYGQKPLSLLSNSSLCGQKHSLKKNQSYVWKMICLFEWILEKWWRHDFYEL